MDNLRVHSELVDLLKAETQYGLKKSLFPVFTPQEVDVDDLCLVATAGGSGEDEEVSASAKIYGAKLRKRLKKLDAAYGNCVSAMDDLQQFTSVEDLSTVFTGRNLEAPLVTGSPTSNASPNNTSKMNSVEARVTWSKFTGNVGESGLPKDALTLLHENDANEMGVHIQLSQNAGAMWRRNKVTSQGLTSLDNMSARSPGGGTESDPSDNQSLAEFLKSLPLFNKVALTELVSYEGKISMQSVDEKEVLFRKGDLSDSLCIIRHGLVGEGYFEDKYDEDSRFIESRRLGMFDHFGALPSDGDNPEVCSADYLVLQPTLLVTVPRDVLDLIFGTAGGILSSVAQTHSIEHASLSDYMHAFKDALDILTISLREEKNLEAIEVARHDAGPSKKTRRSSLQSMHVLTAGSGEGDYALHKMGASKAALALELITIHRPELNFVDTIQHILRLVEDFFLVERVGFFLVDQQSEPWKLELLVSQNDSGTSVPLAGISGHVVKTGELVNIADCYADSRFDPSMDMKTGFKTNQMLAMPVLGHDQTVRGVLQLINTKDNESFSKNQVALVRLVTKHLENLMSSMRSITSVVKRNNSDNDGVGNHRLITEVDKALRVHIRSSALDNIPDEILNKPLVYLQVTMALFNGYTQYGETVKTSHRKISNSNNVVDFQESIQISEMNVNRLPLNSRLVFHLIECTAAGDRIGEPIGWSVVNLFTFEHVMRNGLQRFEMRQGRCTNMNESSKVENRVCEVMLELPKFDRMVVHEVPKRQTLSKASAGTGGGSRTTDSYWNQLSHEERRRLEFFLQDPLQIVQSDSDRALLWKMRYALVVEPDYLPIWLQSVNWFLPDVVSEAYNMMYIWQNVGYTQALQLLDGRFADLKVRAFAVQCLDELRDHELVNYLLPLARNLRCEPFQDSSLARFLLRRSAVAPEIIGVPLLWHLLGESAQGACSKQGLAVKTSLGAVLGEARFIVQKQAGFISAIENVLDGLNEGDSYDDRQATMLHRLASVDVPINSPPVPYAPHFYADDILVSECALHMPVAGEEFSGEVGMDLIISDADGPHELPLMTSFTLGTDLRRQQVVFQAIRTIVSIWDEVEHDVALFVHTQDCLYTGDAVTFTGMPEGVRLADLIAPIVNAGQLSASASVTMAVDNLKNNRTLLEDWFCVQNPPHEMREVRHRYVMSLAGWNVIIYVLGLRNGDFNNVFVFPTGEIQHITFDQFMRGSRAKNGGPQARGSIPFLFPAFFKHVLGGSLSQPLAKAYIASAASAFAVLRKNRALLLSNLSMFINAGIPELRSMQDLGHIRDNFMPDLNDAAASDAFVAMLKKNFDDNK
jgi:hypothetical protein